MMGTHKFINLFGVSKTHVISAHLKQISADAAHQKGGGGGGFADDSVVKPQF